MPNKDNKTPLMQAVDNDDLAMVAFLINLGADVNTATSYTKKTPLMLSVFKGKLKIAQFLCDKNANVELKDINGLNVLHYAVDSNLLSSVQFAVKLVCNVDEKDCNGWTPLMRGSIQNRIVSI